MKAVFAWMIAGLLAASSSAPLAQTAPGIPTEPQRIVIDLNKLEPLAGACRVYFVVENRTAERVAELRLDTFVFDTAGIIGRRVGLTFPDLRPGRTKVVPFDLAGSSCGDVGRMLVNDILACTNQDGQPRLGCADILVATSRVAAAFGF